MITASLNANPVMNAAGLSRAKPLPGAPNVSVFWGDMLEHRDYLVHFAQRRLHDPTLAEDAVHDVFEAVLSGQARFAGRAALRSWLTAILKNKIIDLIRQRARFHSLDAEHDDDDSEAAPPRVSRDAGPDELVEQRELLRQTLQRIEALPQGLREVMQFRVLHDESSQLVCQRLNISEVCLFTRLHRARKQLVC